MEPIKVVIITPTTGLCRMGYAQSLARLVMYFSQVQVFEGVENQWLTVDAIEGSGIGANYHTMIKKYLADKETRWTHFLSLEDDMGFDPDILHILARRRLDIVGCTYKTNKGWPVRWTAISKQGKPLGTSLRKSGVEEAYVIPQGVTLVTREVFEKTAKPWFMQGYDKEKDTYTFAQDYHFCLMAAKAGFKCYVDHDASKKIWHIGTINYRWDVGVENTHGPRKERVNGNPGRNLQPESHQRKPEKQGHGGHLGQSL